MYTSYSTLQRKQLTKQVYTDTQSTYLLVYAPGRHQALEHALENQLHRKFRLVTELAPALTDSVEGVLLVSEDLECTSTALTYFAGALRTGADLVVCDAAFGFDGSTALYLSTQHLPGSRCALVSRALLDEVRAEQLHAEAGILGAALGAGVHRGQHIEDVGNADDFQVRRAQNGQLVVVRQQIHDLYRPKKQHRRQYSRHRRAHKGGHADGAADAFHVLLSPVLAYQNPQPALDAEHNGYKQKHRHIGRRHRRHLGVTQLTDHKGINKT